MLQYGTVSIPFSQYYHNNNHITDSHYASQYHSQLVLIVGALVQFSASTPAKRRIMDPWNYY
jgi:hypothetical protein